MYIMIGFFNFNSVDFLTDLIEFTSWTGTDRFNWS